MRVIYCQRLCIDHRAGFLRRFAELVQKILMVFIILINCRLLDIPIHHMLQRPWRTHSRYSRHGSVRQLILEQKRLIKSPIKILQKFVNKFFFLFCYVVLKPYEN
ncbi:hypothetical protein BIU88_09445 [Chlorobaculum limnaeum]|uniref:Uncharacterized protein n=1 Tax=Chlorobaculum limnaeum TaxID=274537 RepID=A0A1D8CZI3_CHLLM|nr:hypothetical protein [Chlorobaculum limnaeum]AOS84332.1 hypothetical protein BIU88_09445 [Chlorobaculum limnaeum]